MDEAVLQLLGALAVVAAVLALAYLVTRYVVGGLGRTGVKSNGRHLVPMEQLSLGRDQKLLLVRLEDRCLLLGVTPGGITCLKELTQEEMASWQESDAGNPVSGFQEQLRRIWDERKRH